MAVLLLELELPELMPNPVEALGVGVSAWVLSFALSDVTVAEVLVVGFAE